MKRFCLSLIFALSLCGISCTTFKADGLAFLPDVREYEVIKHFKDSCTVHEFLGVAGGSNLFNISSNAMQDKTYARISKQIQKYGGDAAINVSIKYSATFLSVIANLFTGCIWVPAKLKITGDVVRIKNKDDAKVSELETKQAINDAVAQLNLQQ